MTSSVSKLRVPMAVWWLSVGLVALVGGAVVWGLANEQNDLRDRGVQVLSDLPFTLRMDGRDVTLLGTAETYGQIDEAETALVNLRGIRTVNATALIVQGVHETPASITIEHDETETLVRGIVANAEMAEALFAAVSAQFGAELTVNEFAVDAGASSPTWLGELPALIAGLDGWRQGVLSVSQDGASITGVVDSEAVAESITTNLAAGTKLDVSYDLDVIVNRTPWFEVSATDTEVSLAGELSSQKAIEEILAAADDSFVVVVSRLSVAPVIEAPWIESLPELVDHFGTWSSWSLRIIGGVGTIEGRGPSSVENLQTRSGVLDRLGIVWKEIELEVEDEALAAELTAIVSGRINFETASATLDEESRHVLDGIAAVLVVNPSAMLTVEGHTDSQGGEASNLRLSQDRADAVVSYLLDAGIGDDQLTAVGYGEGRPIAENGTTFGRAKNRRIEFVVTGDQG